jgi:hypothetical protein
MAGENIIAIGWVVSALEPLAKYAEKRRAARRANPSAGT